MHFLLVLAFLFLPAVSAPTDDGIGIDPNGRTATLDHRCTIDPNGGPCTASTLSGDRGAGLDPDGN
jgi:hypothetical protein